MKLVSLTTALFISLFTFSSCEKVINIDLKDSQNKVIVEGLITNEAGQLVHSVLLSKSNSFSSTGKNNPIVGALVIVEDSTSKIIDTLKETSPGVYNTKKILGVIGHTYKLNAIINGTSYTASSKMPEAIGLDSLYIQETPFFGNIFKQVVPVFKDDLGTKNYYRFSVQVNDSLQNDIDAWDDLLSDGKVNSRPLNIDDQEALDGDDTLSVTMNTTDLALFNFFNTLENASGNAQTPGNPTSNISGDAIGYFGAITVQKRTIILP
jgi:hypothetical protein